MQAVRRLLAQRHLAALLCMGALLLKLAVPTGYMIDASHGRVEITICPGTASRAGAAEMAPHGDMPDHGGPTHPGKAKDHGKAEMPCPFSGLSAPALGAIHPLLLVGLIAFVMARGLVATRLLPTARRANLRPPPRAPPAYF